MDPAQGHTCDPMRIPVLLPTGRDADLVAGTLGREGIEVVVCSSMHAFLNEIRTGCGPFVIGDEILSDHALYRLTEVLKEQPDWSDLPGIILLRQTRRSVLLDGLSSRRELCVIQRPVKKTILKNLMLTAIESRRRQYQIRDLLADVFHINEKLRSHTRLLQKLALELTRVEAQERKRIAQILHDDLQQMLASAKLQTEMLFDDLKSASVQKARIVYDILSQALEISRNLSHELSPAFLVGENLDDALRKTGIRMAETYGFSMQTTIDIHHDGTSEDIKVFVYRTAQELLFNCAKHARAGRVTLDLIRQGGVLVLTITDDGIGFDPDRLKIRGGDDGGFGLFSIHERAMALGGSFTVRSLPEEGSRFVFIIPCGAEEPDADAASDARSAVVKTPDEAVAARKDEKAGAISVLIADDHAVMRQGLATLLRNQPDLKVVAEAADGEQAVVLALQFRPDVVLMDYSMPVLNGADATRRIKHLAPEITVVGLSMHDDSYTRETLLAAGAQAYLKKDVQTMELIAVIKQHAGHANTKEQP